MAEAYSNRGNAYGELGQPGRAIEDYDEAIKLNADYSDAYVNRALTHAVMDMDAFAVKDISRAVELGIDREALERAVEQVRRRRSHSAVR